MNNVHIQATGGVAFALRPKAHCEIAAVYSLWRLKHTATHTAREAVGNFCVVVFLANTKHCMRTERGRPPVTVQTEEVFHVHCYIGTARLGSPARISQAPLDSDRTFCCSRRYVPSAGPAIPIGSSEVSLCRPPLHSTGALTLDLLLGEAI